MAVIRNKGNYISNDRFGIKNIVVFLPATTIPMSIFFILLPECRPVIGYIQNYRYPYKIIVMLNEDVRVPHI